MARRLVAAGQTPGLAIAVVHRNDVVYVEGFGLRDAGRRESVDGDTVFQIASLSKPISSTVVAAIVSEGLIDWDSRVADLAPDLDDPLCSRYLSHLPQRGNG
jgi:CubicO group peptidase (beta-lactamase class C family)